MTSGHPDGLPELFLDRSLGRRQVPERLRAAGLRLRTLAEVYGIPADEAVADTEWLARAGRSGWVVLMKDDRIRYRPAERTAVIDHQVRAFCLTSGNLRATDMAQQYLAVLDQLTEACRQPGPFLYTVSRTGLRRVPLHADPGLARTRAGGPRRRRHVALQRHRTWRRRSAAPRTGSCGRR